MKRNKKGMMTKGRQQSSVPTLKLTPLPSPFSCKVALAAPWGWRNLARKGGGEGGGATSPQDLAFNKFRPQKLDFEQNCTAFPLVLRVAKGVCLALNSLHFSMVFHISMDLQEVQELCQTHILESMCELIASNPGWVCMLQLQKHNVLGVKASNACCDGMKGAHE